MWTKSDLLIIGMDCISLVPRPGREKEGLVSTACVCAVIIQILNNPIMHGYSLVYLSVDLNTWCSMYLEIAGLDSSNFKRDFNVA